MKFYIHFLVLSLILMKLEIQHQPYVSCNG